MINLEIVEDVFDTIYEILHEDTIAPLYNCEENGITVLSDEYFVVKMFHRKNDGFKRCKDEVKNHSFAYEKNSSCVLKIYKHFQDTFYSCILYDRAYEIDQEEYEENIEKIYEIIQKCNLSGIYNIDTKATNFLKNYDGEFFLHDFGICLYETENLTEEIKIKIYETQMRLMLTGWSSKVPNDFLDKYNLWTYFNLSVDTMYNDYYVELQYLFKNLSV